MKLTTIQIKEDLLNKVNLYKYKFGLKSHDVVVRRLFEICSKIEHAKSSQNSDTTPLFEDGVKPVSSKGGVSNNQEDENV